MKNKKLNKLVKVALLTTIAFLLMFVEFPLPIFPSFLKIDLSDLPALIGAFAFGPVEAVVIELVKNLLHGMVESSSAFVGELSNFMVGSIFVIIAGSIYKRNKTKKTAIIGLILGSIIMTLSAGIFNYYLFLPLYEKLLHFPIKAIVQTGAAINPKITDLNSFVIWAILPFNLIKGVIVSVVTLAVYKGVSPILHREDEICSVKGNAKNVIK